jgi:hypothetical protein
VGVDCGEAQQLPGPGMGSLDEPGRQGNVQ